MKYEIFIKSIRRISENTRDYFTKKEYFLRHFFKKRVMFFATNKCLFSHSH